MSVADVRNSESNVAAMFNRIAGRYDLLNRLLSGRQDQRWRRHLIAMIPERPGGCYVDVATGTGDVVLQAAARRPEYTSFHGVDISDGMLAIARDKSRRSLQSQSIRYSNMSAEGLEFPENSVDCLSISFGLRNVIDRRNGIREFHRVLNKDGRLLILEFFKPRIGLMAFVFNLYFHYLLPAIGGLVSDRTAYRYLPKSVEGFYTFEELAEVMSEEGLSIVDHKSFLFGSCHLISAQKSEPLA